MNKTAQLQIRVSPAQKRRIKLKAEFMLTRFLMIGIYRVFMPGSPTTEFDLLISMLILYIGWTMFALAHSAWASELATSYDGRSRVMS